MLHVCSVILLILLTQESLLASQLGDLNNDYRFISYKDLKESSSKFSKKGVTSYSQLLFDISRSQLIVGARDTLLRLELQNLTLTEDATWTSSEDKIQACVTKGQSEEDCHNFIKVLVTNGKHLFACGTDSFAPGCTWREIDNINNVIERVDGKAKCPYNPHAHISALMTEKGEFYVGAPTDFAGSDYAIYRSITHLNSLRTEQYNSLWLNEPQFVSSFETDKFIYFIFREAAVEYINCGKAIYSRIARVCKNDNGGKLLRRDNWTTFLKARLNCSIPGEYPFYFNEIQSASYVPEEGLVYATFSTPQNGIGGSAICAFNLTAIEATFMGPFKYQEHSNSTWEKRPSNYQNHFECRDSEHSPDFIGSSKYQFMDGAVHPSTQKPIHVAELEVYNHLTVDVLATRLHVNVHVIYVATSEGYIKKISVLPRTMEPCVIEIWQPVRHSSVPILRMQYLKETNSVYVGTEDKLLMIPTSHCGRHRSRDSCINAMDPYCGWNDVSEKCTSAPNRDPLTKYWYQSVTSCPVLNAKIDGGWSSWYDWSKCAHISDPESSGSDRYSNSQGDGCLCRIRMCNNPSPQNGGVNCFGPAIQVINCTVHGGWTSWSAWSECSATCGNAIKTKTRTCTNPSPAHGGRVCVGQDRSEILCTGIPPCPVATPPPRDGGWSSWSSWTSCSSSCGRGFRRRMRECNEPTPSNGGQDCSGTYVEYEECDMGPCDESIELKKISQWSQWFPLNGSEYSRIVRRFRYVCKAPVKDVSQIKLTMHKEDKLCTNNQCSKQNRDIARWSSWSPWSPCSTTCDKGYQKRIRYCEGPGKCRGKSTEKKTCVNLQQCGSKWSCWTDWSVCSVTCGWGIRTRHRTCLGNSCSGHSQEQEPCEQQPCSSLLGWSNWTSWSACDLNGFQHRVRQCKSASRSPNVCQGADKETRICLSHFEIGNDIPQMASCEELSMASGYALGCVLLGMVIGVIATVMIRFGYVIYIKKKNRIPSSPHYMNTKPNSYVPVPLKERPSKKTLPSTSAILNNLNGTLKSAKMNDYEATSPKRNSHNLNNAITKSDKSYYE
ncbi:semaphorin 5c [Onthophagus taurus]|uniref:semaphorin 5c n=1 Tax=Onthophagus taurus TaxID=166361 RepID=UPI000C2004D9|nr:semaphorin-5A [Onthophagus taurus]